MEEDNAAEEAMMAMMGVTGFGSTKVLTKDSPVELYLKAKFTRASMSLVIKKAMQISRKPEPGVNT